MQLSPRQSILLFGWWNPRPRLTWGLVVGKKLTIDAIIAVGIKGPDLVLVQPDPSMWVKHAGATFKKHARFMIPWPANPFIHFKADLADVLSLQPSPVELVRMDVNYTQLVRHGLTDRTEAMFRFDEDDWMFLGKPQTKRA
jgi:hypothetical protein